MSIFGKGDRVVYCPGALGTNLCEEGKSLHPRLRKVVHGEVECVEGGEVIINAEVKEDSGRFPVAQVAHDHSDDPLF